MHYCYWFFKEIICFIIQLIYKSVYLVLEARSEAAI